MFGAHAVFTLPTPLLSIILFASIYVNIYIVLMFEMFNLSYLCYVLFFYYYVSYVSYKSFIWRLIMPKCTNKMRDRKQKRGVTSKLMHGNI